jgi:hypothetical protein
MALPRIEGDLGVPHPGEGAETENRHRYPAPHVGAAGGSRAAGVPSSLRSDRLRRPSARSRGIRARYPVAHWPPALSYPPLE